MSGGVIVTVLGVWVGLNVAFVALRACVTRNRAPSFVIRKRQSKVSQAARTLGKLSDREYQRRKAATTAQLRRELAR